MRGVFNYFMGFFLMGIMLVSCRQDADEPIYIFNIDDEFSLEMKENFYPDKREFAFDVSSVRGFACENIELIAVSSLDKNMINIYIDGFLDFDACGSGDFYPKKEVRVGELLEGEYLLNIYFQGEIQNAVGLMVAEKTFSIIEEEELVGLYFPYKELYKIPEKTMWGRLVYNGEENPLLREELLGILMNYNISEQSLENGRYSPFTIEGDEVIFDSSMSGYINMDNFIFRYSDVGMLELESTLNNFLLGMGEQYDLDLELYSAEGWEF